MARTPAKKTLFVLFSSFFWHSCIHFIILLVNIAWLLNLLWTKEYALSPPWCAQLSLYLSLQIRNPHRTPGRRTQCPFKNNIPSAGLQLLPSVMNVVENTNQPTCFLLFVFLSNSEMHLSSLVLTWCSARRHCVSLSVVTNGPPHWFPLSVPYL